MEGFLKKILLNQTLKKEKEKRKRKRKKK